MSFSTAKQAVFKAINTARQEARLGDREEIEREREGGRGERGGLHAMPAISLSPRRRILKTELVFVTP
jgi:hypothetical protein